MLADSNRGRLPADTNTSSFQDFAAGFRFSYLDLQNLENLSLELLPETRGYAFNKYAEYKLTSQVRIVVKKQRKNTSGPETVILLASVKLKF